LPTLMAFLFKEMINGSLKCLWQLVLDDLGEFCKCHQDVDKSVASRKSPSGSAYIDSTAAAVAAFNRNSGLSNPSYDSVVQSRVEWPLWDRGACSLGHKKMTLAMHLRGKDGDGSFNGWRGITKLLTRKSHSS
jgi:hypothetical protein